MRRFEASCLERIRRRGDGVRGCRVLVACSGGGDSVALLALLWALRRSLDVELCVAHAAHGLRPEAEEDAAFVARLCRRLDLDLVEARLDVRGHAERSGQGLETAARELRWAWFEAEAASCGAAVVATGHSLDDHTETVFLRLARGSGLACLTPLPPRQGLRWSPLVDFRREALRDYLRQLGWEWREDASNGEGFTPRNRWRQLLEDLRREAPALDRHLLETHLQVAELREFQARSVAAWRGPRWELVDGVLRLRDAFLEAELRWVLEAAFREAGWPREAARLRDLAAWIRPLLARKRRRTHAWGGWRLEPEPLGWSLHPEDGSGRLEPTSLEAP